MRTDWKRGRSITSGNRRQARSGCLEEHLGVRFVGGGWERDSREPRPTEKNEGREEEGGHGAALCAQTSALNRAAPRYGVRR